MTGHRNISAGDRAGQLTLARLVELLGGSVLRVLAAPGGLATTVHRVVLADVETEGAVSRHDLVLAPGIEQPGTAVRPLIDAAVAGGAAAVVVKTGRRSSEIVEAALASGVTVLVVPATMTWDQAYTLLKTAGRAGSADQSGLHELMPGDLFGLANAIAAIVGGAVTIEDFDNRVLAYSNLDHRVDRPRELTILGRRVPQIWEQSLVRQGVFRTLYQRDEVISVVANAPRAGARPAAPRLAVAVRAGDEVLGSIWVISPTTDPAERNAAAEALRSLARSAAVHLLHHRNRELTRGAQRSDALRNLLTQAPPDPADGEISVPEGTPLTLLGIGMGIGAEPADSRDEEALRDRIAGIVTVYMQALYRHAYITVIGRHIYVLVASTSIEEHSAILLLVNDLRQRIDTATGASARIAIGRRTGNLFALPTVRAEVEQTLEAMRRFGRAVGVAEEMQQHVALMLLERYVARDPRLSAGKVVRLVDHDRRRGTDHLATLRAYLDNGCDAAAAAADLGLHRNTFRYRLRRLLEISGIGLDDADERLITHLQVRHFARSRESTDQPATPPLSSPGTESDRGTGLPRPRRIRGA